MARTGGVVAVVVLLCGGCSGSRHDRARPTDAALAKVIVERSLPGFALNARASGSLDAATAADAFPVDASAVRRALDGSSFRGGYSRVWTSDESFVAIVVLDFDLPVDAGRFSSMEVGSLRDAHVVYVTAVADIPNGSAYVLSANTKAKSRPVFCEGVAFSIGTWAFDVRTCDPFPSAITRARTLAAQQYAHAFLATRPTPSPARAAS